MTTIDRILSQPVRPNKVVKKPVNQPSPEARFSGGGESKGAVGSSRLATAALLAASLGGLFPAGAKAEISPTSGKVVQWVNSAVQDKQGKQKDWKELSVKNWNDVRVGLRVTDDVRELDLNPLREQLLRDGARNASIPFEVVHEAINTAGTLGSVLQDEDLNKSVHYKGQNLTAEDLRGQLAQLILPYRDRVVVNVKEVKDGKEVASRYFVPAEALFGVEGNNIEAYDLRSVADNALAKLGHKSTLDVIAKQMLESGTNTAKRDEMFGILRQASPSIQQPEVTSKVVEWVYGKSDPLNTAAAKAAKPTPAKAETPEVKKMHEHQGGNTSDGIFNFLPPFVGETEGGNAENNVPADLTKPSIVEITPQNRQQVAQSIAYLADRDHELALPAAAQWFLKRGYTHNTRDIQLDMQVLKGLAKKAQTDEKAFTVLKQVAATHPMIVGNAFLSAQQLRGTIDMVKAGDEVIAAFKSHPVQAHGLILDMFNRKAQILWKDPKDESGKQSLQGTRDLGRDLALIVMASDKRGTFAEQLRSLPENRFEDAFARQVGLVGLAWSRDTQSIDMMLRIASNPQEDDWLKSLALEAALVTDTPHDMLPAVMEKAYAAQPFSMSAGQFFVQQDVKTGELKFDRKANPFHKRISQRYEKMMQEATVQREIAAKNGRLVSPVSQEERMDMVQKAIHAEFGGVKGSALLAKGQDKAFQAKYLAPLAKYLETTNQDPNLAIPTMLLMGKTGYEPSADILNKIVRTPEKYHMEVPDEMGFFAILLKGILPAVYRVNAAEALGGAASPADPKADVLHDLLKDPFLPYQFASLAGLDAMGQRHSELLNRADQKAPTADEASRKAGLDKHANRTVDYLKRVQSGLHDIQQRRRVRDFLSYEAVRVADHLGGRDALKKYAAEVKVKDPKAGVLRSIGQGMLSNDYKRDGLEHRAYDDEAVKTFNEKGYWGIDSLHKMGASGKGGEHAHFDVGYINPVTKDLKESVVYPNWMRWNDEWNFVEPHPTGTAETVRLVAPGVKMYNYNVAEGILPDIHAPEAANDPLNKGLEDLLQRQMLPEGHPDRTQVTTTNHSYGFMNAVMYLKPFREQIIDLSSAYLEALGETGVTNFVSAGNSQADGPFGSYDPVGSVNTLGSRVDKDGKVTKSNSTVLVSAVDGFQKWLAEFSSMPNPLRLDEALEMMGAPGYQEMTLYKNDRGVWERIPVDGTSFSSPNLAGATQLAGAGKKNPNLAVLVKVADKARENAGLTPWTHDQRQEALRASAEALPGREKWETGLYVDPLKFLIEAIKQGEGQGQVEKAEAQPPVEQK